jgi:hypothetical protein
LPISDVGYGYDYMGIAIPIPLEIHSKLPSFPKEEFSGFK